jgi:cytochrome c-type biogenesis protein CcmF
MDLGTILLIAAVAAGALDAIVLILGPKLRGYESKSFITSAVSFLTALGAIVWLGGLIFTNQFQYDYVNETTNISANVLLKLSALWAGQSGSLVFWTFLSFGLYFAFRAVTRGYEDDKLVSRAAIIMVIESAFIAINALVADPFRVTTDIVRTDGYGLNPLLSTIWNVIHPPIIFIGYALLLVPFAIKLAGFTMSSEERNQDPIPVVGALTRLTTVASWLTLSAGIFIGGYWAYIVLGWGGYWGWDPVETTSLIPWLLVTAFYHAKPTLTKNDVLRDSFLVMGYIAVVFATWVTRSGVLSSVHGFGLSLVSWTMLITLLINVVIGISFALYAGFRDMEDDDGQTSAFAFFDYKNARMFSIKMSLVGIIIVASTSTIGVVLPAVVNLGIAIFDPANLADGMIGIDIEFFRMGFYVCAVFLIASAFYCMRTDFLSHRRRGILVLILFGVGGLLAILSVLGNIPLPTNYWPANFLVPAAIGAIAFLAIAFALPMAGKSEFLNMRQLGRLMLHLGLVILLFGVFMSENVVYEDNSGYLENGVSEVAPGIFVRVSDIDLHHWVHDRDFNMIVTIEIIENNQIIGIGYATVQGHPGWGMVTHQVYVQTTAFRDVFIAVTGFSTVTTIPQPVYQVTVHTKILPFVSFVWLGPFLMIAAMLPMFAIEVGFLRKSLKKKDEHLYEDEILDEETHKLSNDVIPDPQGN